MSKSSLHNCPTKIKFNESLGTDKVLGKNNVDDMVDIRYDYTSIFKLWQHLGKQFKMKNLDGISYFLGLEVTLDSSCYYFSQAKYATDILFSSMTQ